MDEPPGLEAPPPPPTVWWPGAELPLRGKRVVFSVDHSSSVLFECGDHYVPPKWTGVFERLSNGMHPDELGHYPRWASILTQLDAAVDALEEGMEFAGLRWGSTNVYVAWEGYRKATPENKAYFKRWMRGRGISMEATDTGTLGLAFPFATWPDADVILITDGAPTVSPAGGYGQVQHEDEISYALRQFLAAHTGQRVHCVGILPPYRREEAGPPCGWSPHHKTKDDFRNFLRDVARWSGGRFVETH